MEMKHWHDVNAELLQYLCPAGEGVYTVSTATDNKNNLQQLLYGSVDDARDKWQQSIASIPNIKKPLLIGMCADTGGGILRGANWGPLFIRETYYGRYGFDDVHDIGDVRVIPQLLLDEYVQADLLSACRQALYQDPNSTLAVSPLSIAEAVCHNIYEAFPTKKMLTIGGDHSTSYPFVKTFMANMQQQQRNTALIHFDAHTDIQQQRLGIPINFGSWVYHILQQMNEQQHLIQIGIRATNQDKDYWHKTYRLKQFWAEEFKQQGVNNIAKQVIQYLQKNNIETLYISFDVDCLDATIVSATGTPEQCGLQLDDVLTLITMLTNTSELCGADVMEVAPFVRAGKACGTNEPQSTLNAAAEILQCFVANM